MIALLLSEASGWLIAVLAAITVTLPYMARGRRFAPEGWDMSYLQRLTPHYWVGYTIAGLSLLHAGFAMSAPMPPQGSFGTGIWIATGGMLLVFGQVTLGLRLRELRGSGRLRLRRWHVAVVIGLAAIGALHLWLNGPLVQAVARLI